MSLNEQFNNNIMLHTVTKRNRYCHSSKLVKLTHFYCPASLIILTYSNRANYSSCAFSSTHNNNVYWSVALAFFPYFFNTSPRRYFLLELDQLTRKGMLLFVCAIVPTSVYAACDLACARICIVTRHSLRWTANKQLVGTRCTSFHLRW